MGPDIFVDHSGDLGINFNFFIIFDSWILLGNEMGQRQPYLSLVYNQSWYMIQNQIFLHPITLLFHIASLALPMVVLLLQSVTIRFEGPLKKKETGTCTYFTLALNCKKSVATGIKSLVKSFALWMCPLFSNEQSWLWYNLLNQIIPIP